jgi:uncharacterized protein
MRKRQIKVNYVTGGERREVLEAMHANFPEIAFSVCGSTKSIVEEREGHAQSFIEGTKVVPLGLLRLVELQVAGWSYIRP